MSLTPLGFIPAGSVIRGRQLRSDLAENGSQFVKVHRLGQMKIETGRFAALNIVRRSKSGQRYRLDGSFSFGLGNQIIAAAVGQSDIGQNDIKIFRMDNFPCTLRIIGHGNFVAEMCEQTGQRLQRVAVIFDHQNPQTFTGI